MSVKGINHLGLEVSDLERSTRFYCEVLGMEKFYQEPFKRVYLNSGDDILTLQKTEEVRSTTGVHFGFLLSNPDEMVQWKEALSSKGVEIENEELRDHGWSIYFRDPDGYLIETFYINGLRQYL